MLSQFTDSSVLHAIGPIRVAKLLASFNADLTRANVTVPPAPDPVNPPVNGEYFDSVAALLRTASLPEPFVSTLATLERAAAPENSQRLDASIQRRLPCISLNRDCPLDCALELFFAAPNELAQFVTPKPDEGGSSPGSVPSIQNPKSKIEIPPGWVMQVEPWPGPVQLSALLHELRQLLNQFVVLPKWVAETLALWILHTYAFELRSVTTYIGIESPIRRCGKTTLLTILCRLVNRPVVSANVSSSSFYRAIQELKPTLMIDEADRFLKSKDIWVGDVQAKGYLKKDFMETFRRYISKSDLDALAAEVPQQP